MNPLTNSRRAWVCALAITAFFAVRAHAQCTIDAQGPDDEPGQKDMTQVCAGGTCNTTGISISWSLDDTKWTGSNTSDACALFDSDNNGNADRAVCVSVGGNSVIEPGQPRCFTCGDTAPD